MTLIDGSVKTFPVAVIEVDSPYFKGKVEAVCMPGSLCDVVVGNVEGAREPGDPDFEWMPPSSEEVTSEVKDVAETEISLVEEESDSSSKGAEAAVVVDATSAGLY